MKFLIIRCEDLFLKINLNKVNFSSDLHFSTSTKKFNYLILSFYFHNNLNSIVGINTLELKLPCNTFDPSDKVFKLQQFLNSKNTTEEFELIVNNTEFKTYE